MTAESPAPGRQVQPGGIAGLVLAAGESSRMAPLGMHKALLDYRGRTFLENIVATLQEGGVGPVVVVLGHGADEIRRRLAGKLEPARMVVNRDYKRGQTTSLQVGLRALAAAEDEPRADALILCLVDHPTVLPETVQGLVKAFRQSGAPAVVPTHRNQGGHPVLISSSLFAELSRLGLHEGANTVIRKYRHATQFLAVDDPGVLVDVDDPESYDELVRSP